MNADDIKTERRQARDRRVDARRFLPDADPITGFGEISSQFGKTFRQGLVVETRAALLCKLLALPRTLDTLTVLLDAAAEHAYDAPSEYAEVYSLLVDAGDALARAQRGEK